MGIESLAEEIKTHFVIKKKMIAPNYFCPNNERFQKAFIEAANICDRLNADPIFFVEAQFAKISAEKMQVDFLHSRNAETYYKDYMLGSYVTPQERLDGQLHLLQVTLKNLRWPIEKLLNDDELSFEPWFRVCITKKPNFDLLKKYGQEAKSQLEETELYEFLKGKGLDVDRPSKKN